MYFRNHVSFLLLLIALILPSLLSALPENLEVFTDFENISGEGEFFIGDEPETEEGVRLCILTFNKKCQNAEPDPFCISG